MSKHLSCKFWSNLSLSLSALSCSCLLQTCHTAAQSFLKGNWWVFFKSPKKIGDKNWRFSIRRTRGVWGEPGFVVVVVRPSSSVVSPKPESSESPKKAKSRKKMERPTTAGAACRRAQRPATPAHAQAPRRQLPNQGVAKNGELLDPKVEGQMGYSKANIRANEEVSTRIVQHPSFKMQTDNG